jgi:hypothetical protein
MEPLNLLTFYQSLALKSFKEHPNPCSTNSMTQRPLTRLPQRLGIFAPQINQIFSLKVVLQAQVTSHMQT